MTRDRAEAILYESEAALRLVDQQLDDLGVSADPREAVAALARPFADPSVAIEEAGAQVARCLARVRAGRATLAPALPADGAPSHDERTADGAHPEPGVLDACERAVGLLDRLEAASAAEGVALRAALRDELFGMIAALQFPAPATRALAQCADLLGEVEHRLVEVEAAFGGGWVGRRESGDRVAQLGGSRVG